MKYFTLLIGLLFVIPYHGKAQTVKEYFLNMPASYMPYLTKINKEDMLDFIESHMAAKVKNRFQSTTEMKQLHADYLEIETTSASTLQLKVLPYKNNTNLLALVTTVNGPVADSRIQFFTEDWKEIPGPQILTLPPVESFLLPVGTVLAVDSTYWTDSVSMAFKMQELNPLSLLTDLIDQPLYDYLVQRLQEVYLCSMTFGPGDSSLQLVLNTPDYLDGANRQLVKQCMKQGPLLLRWQTDRFEITD